MTNMQLISLNIWGGHVLKPLMEFIQKHSEIDIFCLQEVYHKAPDKVSTDDRTVYLDVFTDLQKLLPNHLGLFRPVVAGSYGIGMFIKKDIAILDEGEIEVYSNPYYSGMGPAHSRILQWVSCQIRGQEYTVMNFHGLWNGVGKSDSPDRILQSKKIHNFLQTIQTPKILCGDFNLRPDTISLEILESGMNNLIKLHQITSTRSAYYPKEEKFADYVLTSSDIQVHQFDVLENEVSDHYPLYLHCSA